MTDVLINLENLLRLEGKDSQVPTCRVQGECATYVWFGPFGVANHVTSMSPKTMTRIAYKGKVEAIVDVLERKKVNLECVDSCQVRRSLWRTRKAMKTLAPQKGIMRT